MKHVEYAIEVALACIFGRTQKHNKLRENRTHFPRGTFIQVPWGALVDVLVGTRMHTPGSILIHVLRDTLIKVPWGTRAHIPRGTLTHVVRGTLIYVPRGARRYTPRVLSYSYQLRALTRKL